jgi:hypothetical protein
MVWITVTDGRITGISLQSNGLDGTIPFSINYLQKLSYLRLDSNELQGSIPATFSIYLNLYL